MTPGNRRLVREWAAGLDDKPLGPCLFSDRPGECWPRVDRAHWLPKQTIRREFPFGARMNVRSGRIAPCRRVEDFASGGEPWVECAVELVLFDPRVIFPACRYHHAQLDNGRLKVARVELPDSLLEFADEYGLFWLVDRMYGEGVSDRGNAAA